LTRFRSFGQQEPASLGDAQFIDFVIVIYVNLAISLKKVGTFNNIELSAISLEYCITRVHFIFFFHHGTLINL